jgi:hypothetical protein
MDDQTTHYSALQRTDRYLRIDQLEDGCLYLIHARNSHIGQWVAVDCGFVILREKFGDRFIFTEYHWDKDKRGTAKPLAKLSGIVAADALREVLEEKLREIPYSVFMERTRGFTKWPETTTSNSCESSWICSRGGFVCCCPELKNLRI